MIKAALVGDAQTIERIKGMGSAVRLELKRTIEQLSIKLQIAVKKENLTGQVLNVQTGRLRRSVTYKIEQTTNGTFGYVGTNVEYGKLWEYGFSQKIGAGTRGGPRNLTGQALNTYMSKHPPGIKKHKARSFLRAALADMQNEIREQIRSAAVRVARK